MGISFLGHTQDYNFWVFDIDGKTFLARNNSTKSPLRLNFKEGRFFGNYSIDKIIPGAVLVKISGFDIISGTSQTSGNSAGMVLNGIVEWTWAGQKYRNRWTLTEGMELSPAIPEEGVEGTYAYDLDIQPPYTPYDGPAGGAVGTGVTSQATIAAGKTKDEREALEAATTQISPSAQLSTAAPEQQYPLPMTVASRPVTAGIASPAAIQAAQSGAMTKDQREALAGQSGEAIQETQDAIAAAFKALSVSKSQGTVNVNAFNNARTELKNAKDALTVAQSRATSGEQVLMSQLQEQVDTIQGEVDIQLRYLQATTQPVTKPVSTGIVSNAAIAQSNKSKEDIEASTAYKTPGYTQPVYPSQVTPPATYTPASTGMTRMTTSPVIIPGTKDAREAAEAAAAAGTDWVKLGLQIGAAYLLFS